MKIAVASEGKSLNSMISSRAGRAPFYLIFEGKSLIEVVKNPFAVGGGGAGWSVAYMLSEKGVDLVICLLYTSPSPRDLSTSRMPSSA